MAPNEIEFTLLRPIPEAERRELIAHARRRTFSRGDIIFHEGDVGDALHLIEQGRVGVRSTTPLGDVTMLSVLGPGEFFGEAALVGREDFRSATIVALEPLQTRSIYRDYFRALRVRHPVVDRLIEEALVTQVRRLTEHLLEALYVPIEPRVFRRLVALSESYRAEDGSVVISLTQDDLASLAGATRPTVNRVLKAAEEAGVIAIRRGRIEILDEPELARRTKLS